MKTTELTLKGSFPYLADEDIKLIGSVIDTAQDRNNARSIISKQRKEFVAYDGSVPISDFLTNLYHEAYKHGWKHLYHSPVGLKGHVSGDWWEDFNKAILKAAALKTQTNFVVGSKKKNSGKDHDEDHDNFLGTSKDDIWISEECKLQSDKTSLKKALDSYNQNKSHARHCCISFATNNVFKVKNGGTAVKVIVERGISEGEAKNVVMEINKRKCGVFNVNGGLSFVILGYNNPEYKAWDNKNMSNHGGAKGWTLSPNSITEIVDFFVYLLEDMASK